MDRVVHFEIPADDLDRAKAFYGSVFGWGLEDQEMAGGTYTMARTVPTDERQMPAEPGAINGALIRRSHETPHPILTIQVDAIDDALARVEAGGGRVVTPRTEVPGVGWFAYVEDPEGNTLGLWERAF
ncbi:MAG TPA: VOC family protein [Actinomycetota bacterium]|nr:VOC family protein [Actinomycetota bacterium]